MELILEKSAAVTILCRGKLLCWAERGILLGEMAVKVEGGKEDERICFAVEAEHNICLAGATRFEIFYPELRLPVTPYIVEMQQGIISFVNPAAHCPGR